MQYFLTNLDSNSNVGPFETLEQAESYKTAIPGYWDVKTVVSPDMAIIAATLVLSIVAQLSEVVVDGIALSLNTRKITAIRRLKDATGLSIREGKDLVDRVWLDYNYTTRTVEFVLQSTGDAAARLGRCGATVHSSNWFTSDYCLGYVPTGSIVCSRSADHQGDSDAHLATLRERLTGDSGFSETPEF